MTQQPSMLVIFVCLTLVLLVLARGNFVERQTRQ